jgi:hypothetical protein
MGGPREMWEDSCAGRGLTVCAIKLMMIILVRFEVFTAVTMKKAVFWDVAPCRSGVNRRFGGTYRLHIQGRGEK